MKLIDAIKLSGRPFEIPDASRDDLPQFFQEMGFKEGAEIGVDKGEFTEKFAQAGLNIFGVDSWVWSKDYDSSRSQEHYDNIYEQAKARLAPYSNATIIRKTSMEAVEDFKDESLDFVYIDGNHKLKYVIEDIVEWSKKIKSGGIIAGHDYVQFKPRSKTGISMLFQQLMPTPRPMRLIVGMSLVEKRLQQVKLEIGGEVGCS